MSIGAKNKAALKFRIDYLKRLLHEGKASTYERRELVALRWALDRVEESRLRHAPKDEIGNLLGEWRLTE